MTIPVSAGRIELTETTFGLYTATVGMVIPLTRTERHLVASALLEIEAPPPLHHAPPRTKGLVHG